MEAKRTIESAIFAGLLMSGISVSESAEAQDVTTNDGMRLHVGDTREDFREFLLERGTIVLEAANSNEVGIPQDGSFSSLGAEESEEFSYLYYMGDGYSGCNQMIMVAAVNEGNGIYVDLSDDDCKTYYYKIDLQGVSDRGLAYFHLDYNLNVPPSVPEGFDFHGVDLPDGSCNVASSYTNTLKGSNDEIYLVVPFDPQGKVGQVSCDDVEHLLAKKTTPASVDSSAVEEPAVDVEEVVEDPIQEDVLVNEEKLGNGISVSGVPSYSREAFASSAYNAPSLALAANYQHGRFVAGVDADLVFAGNNGGFGETHMDRGGSFVGLQIGGKNLSVVPQVGGGVTIEPNTILENTWYASLGADLVYNGIESLQKNNLVLVATLDTGFDRDRVGYPIAWDMSQPWVRAGLGLQWSYVGSGSREKKVDPVEVASYVDTADTGDTGEIPEQLFDEPSGLKYFDMERGGLPSYVDNAYNSDSSSKEQVAIGEFNVHFGEMQEKSKDNTWKAVESRYQKIQGLIGMDVLWTCVNRDQLADYYFLGAQAARNNGNTEEVYLRLQFAAKAAPGREDIEIWMEDLEANYFGVEFKGVSIFADNSPFPPDQRSAIAYANELLNEEGSFSGYLPFCDNNEFYVVRDKRGRERRFDVPELR